MSNGGGNHGMNVRRASLWRKQVNQGLAASYYGRRKAEAQAETLDATRRQYAEVQDRLSVRRYLAFAALAALALALLALLMVR